VAVHSYNPSYLLRQGQEDSAWGRRRGQLCGR
jgi:hypothetical protein